ncbi:MAG TPA: UvrD-helicase domain-containing protein, partial [Rhizomicrobium sp.]|nr:UvrD-helicase domain-containing protein [Rhizomicrobium sp.]
MNSPQDDLALRLPLSGVQLIEASAGTGKTFTLTAWVLRLLLEGGVPLPKLLVVTFTRAATAELRDRVRRRLRIAEYLLNGGTASDDEDRQTAALIEHARLRGIDDVTLDLRLQAALLQLDEAAISTIHGFCQRALREFGFLAGALNDDEIIDNAGELWDDVAADLWRTASTGDAQGFQHLCRLWSAPDALARSLPRLCDPARRLLPEAGESDLAAWLHELRNDAGARFEQALAERSQRTHDQLIEQVWQASAQPAFAAALRQRWPMMLVDEFQDTDPRQWEIFRRIFEAEGEAEAGLFLIGDPKQAIYRFRGGDLPTYLQAREFARAHGSEASLDINYRSRPAVLAAIETLFTANNLPFIDPGIEFHHVHASARADDAALKVNGEIPPGLVVHWLPPDPTGKSRRAKEDDTDSAVAMTVAEIVRLLNHGTLTDDRGERRLRPSDIAVLVRQNKQVAWMRDALAAAGISAATQSNDSVFASETAGEVRALLLAF